MNQNFVMKGTISCEKFKDVFGHKYYVYGNIGKFYTDIVVFFNNLHLNHFVGTPPNLINRHL